MIYFVRCRTVARTKSYTKNPRRKSLKSLRIPAGQRFIRFLHTNNYQLNNQFTSFETTTFSKVNFFYSQDKITVFGNRGAKYFTLNNNHNFFFTAKSFFSFRLQRAQTLFVPRHKILSTGQLVSDKTEFGRFISISKKTSSEVMSMNLR